jgi:hypothetical protein
VLAHANPFYTGVLAWAFFAARVGVALKALTKGGLRFKLSLVFNTTGYGTVLCMLVLLTATLHGQSGRLM